jgi:hypothetical protein
LYPRKNRYDKGYPDEDNPDVVEIKSENTLVENKAKD